ncbi:prepilin peptidase, partial [Acinetobacter baumannii]
MLSAALAVFAVLSVVLAVIDHRHHRLPHALVLPGLALALALLTSAALAAGQAERIAGVWGGAAS